MATKVPFPAVRRSISLMLCALVLIGPAHDASASNYLEFEQKLAVASFQSVGSEADQGLLNRIGRTFIIKELELLLEPHGIGVFDESSISPASQGRSTTPRPPRFGEQQEPGYDFVLHISYRGEGGVVFANPRIQVVASGDLVSLDSIAFDTSDILGSSRATAAQVVASGVFGIGDTGQRVVTYKCFGLDEALATEFLRGSVSEYELMIAMPRDVAEEAARRVGPKVVARPDTDFDTSRGRCGRDYRRPDRDAGDLADSWFVLSGQYNYHRSGFIAEVVLLEIETGLIEVLEVGPERQIEDLYYLMRKTLPMSVSRILRDEGR